MEQVQRSKVLKWVLAIAIVIVLNLFFAFAIRLGYKEPKWETFCPEKQVNTPIETEEKCLESGGQWNNYGHDYNYRMSKPVPAPSITEVEPKGYCNEQYTCGEGFNTALSKYNRNVFVILIVLGVISLGVGYAVGASSAVSLGLSLGGILSLIIASIRYWSDMDDIIRVIILGLALIALIWFGIKKFKD